MGFSLLEVIVVLFVMSVLSGILVANFRASATTKTARHQSALVFVSDVRVAQSRASSGTNFNGVSVCGFGIHYVDSTTYLLYAGAESTCSTANRNFEVTDAVIQTKKLTNTNMEFAGSFSDIFFEPPDPLTYINNSPALANSTLVSIRVANVPGLTTDIKIYGSGAINIDN